MGCLKKLFSTIQVVVLSFTIFSIELYQKFLSPLMISRCNYYPTCSSYAIDSLKYHGFRRGSWRFFKRFIRCNILNKKRIYDPVTDTVEENNTYEH